MKKSSTVFFNQFENLFVSNGVFVRDDNKLFSIFDQLSNVFSKQRKRRVCHDNIGLLQQFDTFAGTEIPVFL